MDSPRSPPDPSRLLGLVLASCWETWFTQRWYRIVTDRTTGVEVRYYHQGATSLPPHPLTTQEENLNSLQFLEVFLLFLLLRFDFVKVWHEFPVLQLQGLKKTEERPTCSQSFSGWGTNRISDQDSLSELILVPLFLLQLIPQAPQMFVMDLSVVLHLFF